LQDFIQNELFFDFEFGFKVRFEPVEGPAASKLRLRAARARRWRTC